MSRGPLDGRAALRPPWWGDDASRISGRACDRVALNGSGSGRDQRPPANAKPALAIGGLHPDGGSPDAPAGPTSAAGGDRPQEHAGRAFRIPYLRSGSEPVRDAVPFCTCRLRGFTPPPTTQHGRKRRADIRIAGVTRSKEGERGSGHARDGRSWHGSVIGVLRRASARATAGPQIAAIHEHRRKRQGEAPLTEGAGGGDRQCQGGTKECARLLRSPPTYGRGVEAARRTAPAISANGR
jgi:hypothetical protein